MASHVTAIALVLAGAIGCGSSVKSGNGFGPDGTAPVADSGSDATMATDSGQSPDSAAPPSDSGRAPDTATAADTGGPPAGWNGTFSGPLACSAPASYATNWANTCGTERWSIKTGSDSKASTVSLLPTLTTVASLAAIPSPSPFPSSSTPRQSPAETTAFALKDVTLSFARLEDDSDYHLVLGDGTTTLITEVPYPGCISSGPWSCLVSHARAAVEASIGVGNLVLDMGHNHNLTVSVVGVGFFDPEHGQFGVAANNLELHAILAICFGKGCDPTK